MILFFNEEILTFLCVFLNSTYMYGSLGKGNYQPSPTDTHRQTLDLNYCYGNCLPVRADEQIILFPYNTQLLNWKNNKLDSQVGHFLGSHAQGPALKIEILPRFRMINFK